MVLVGVSFTATMGYLRAPEAAMALSLMTPVVVSSLPATTSSSCWGLSRWRVLTRSQPSSMVMWGWKSKTWFMHS